MLMKRYHPFTGGYQTQSLRLGRELLRRRIDLRVVTERVGRLAPYEVHERIPVHRVPAFGKGHLAAACYLVSSLAWMARNRRFQIIHANRVSSGIVAGLIGLVLGKKVLCRPTNGEEIRALGVGLLGWLKLQCLRRTVHRFVAITRGIESDLKRLGVAPERIVRIDNGMDLEVSPRDGSLVRSKLGWDDKAAVVAFVGRLVPEKGVDWLLDAWRTVASQSGAARLLVVGDGPERRALEARAERLGIAATVAFVGWQKDVFSHLAAADVFVLPSRREGCSNALLEAMSQGLPVVVADDALGGNREIAKDGRDGYLVPLEDTETLGARLLELVRNPALRDAMGRRARRTMERERSIECAAERYCEVYQAMLGGRERPLHTEAPSRPTTSSFPSISNT
jgi:L-malate glycosyltransferase